MSQFDRLGNDMSDDIADALSYEQLLEEGGEVAAYNAESDMEYAYEERMSDGVGPYGDARRCPRHPHVKTSSDNGMFDCECYMCETEADREMEEWEYSPENPHRPYCRKEPTMPYPYIQRATCKDEVDNIPF